MNQLWDGAVTAKLQGRAAAFLSAALVASIILISMTGAAYAGKRGPGAVLKAEAGCADGTLLPGNGENLEITKPCTVGAGTYHYHYIHVYDGGVLQFTDAAIDFWASSILVQNKGALVAGVNNYGTPNQTISPIGTNGGKIVIHLWGTLPKEGERPIACLKQKNGGGSELDLTCGVPSTVALNQANQLNPGTCTPTANLPGGVTNECFYIYDSLAGDGSPNIKAYFGSKVLAVSFGGTLLLYGKKGALYPDTKVDASTSGTSWVRLNNCASGNSDSQCTNSVLKAGATTLTLSAPVDWKTNDYVILGATDYLPGHSEVVQLKSDANGTNQITLQAATKYPHDAAVYSLSSLPPNTGLTDLTAVDTRAAVGLLSRDIRIVSGGDSDNKPFPPENDPKPDRFFGGQVIARQGFQAVQLQGVEFYQLGEGGRIGHYPIHFHMDRQVPANTFVKDCSIWDSMTRWIVLHATQGLLLARNVGYKSIGHGYYLEDGTEVNNKLYSNLGVSALAAVADSANTRKVPGLLASLEQAAPEVPYKTDYTHPTVFWVMNGWNDMEFNQAVGAEACGLCYWMVPGNNSGGSRKENWVGYASEQRDFDHDGTTPIKEFYGNQCSTASQSFVDIADVPTPCHGITDGSVRLAPITEDNNAPVPAILDPKQGKDLNNEKYYPIVHGGFRKATLCSSETADCARVNVCQDSDRSGCAVTVLDHFVSSFTTAETNFAAVWMRPMWSLFINSAITDALNGGITFVTGGGYTRSDAMRGMWLLARKSVFIGNTQTVGNSSAPDDPYALNGGPVNPYSGVTCKNSDINYCIPYDKTNNIDLGASYQLSNFGTNQRFFSIYDGPSYQDSNAYLDITPTTLTDCDLSSDTNVKRCRNSAWMQGRILGIPGQFAGAGKKPAACYLPNAAIAWKQPNGFFYPPGFHSDNLFFNKVDIRHFVIEPLFNPGTYQTNTGLIGSYYCNAEPSTFNNFTDIDRQTELNDDDGSLTGLINTVSVNQDLFFKAPEETVECKSDIPANTAGTATTSPYDYVTTIIYPDTCSSGDPRAEVCQPQWAKDCGNPNCAGVKMYRQLLNPNETQAPYIRMAGQKTGQRSTLTPNNGTYYIDTTQTASEQGQFGPLYSVFTPSNRYHVFLIYAKPATTETYQMFVGKNLNTSDVLAGVVAETVSLNTGQYQFTKFNTGTPANDWPDTWVKNYDPGTGILQVTMNMTYTCQTSQPCFKTDYTNSIPGRCQPAEMCEFTNNQCQCSNDLITNPQNPLHWMAAECQADSSKICASAIKDIDFPDGGAYGFSFNLTVDPTAGSGPSVRPAPSCFPNNVAWNVPFAVASPDVAGSCYYNPPPPGPQFCPTPTATPTP